MENIKFRAWDNKTKSFYKPVYEAYNGKLHELIMNIYGNRSIRTMDGVFGIEKDDYIIMQSTGLLDNNGVEVYEGDIVKDEFRKNVTGQEDINIGVIKFYSPSFYVCPPNASKFIIPFNQNILVENSVNFSVIGNIYQNPGLLN